MEHFRLTDDCSPPLTADSVTPFFPADSLLPPNRREFEDEMTALNVRDDGKTQFPIRKGTTSDPLRLNRLFRHFERPSFARMGSLTVLCLIAYPALYGLTFVARDRPLFTVRLIVAMWCSGVGFALGYTLLGIGVRHIEATTWTTVIQMSYQERGGMKLGDLARYSEDPTSILSALQILLYRFKSRETTRGSRGPHDTRSWFLSLVFFLVLATVGSLLPFLFGRIMDIKTYVHNQRTAYREVLIAGDLSQDDVGRAKNQLEAFESFAQTWTLLPYGTSPPDYVEFAHDNDTVYFPQPSLSQFILGNSGLGNFNPNRTGLPKGSPSSTKLVLSNGTDGMGAVLRYPQWGIRIHCKKLPDPEVNLIPLSNRSLTYAVLPQDLLRGLFTGYDLELPTSLTKPDLTLLAVNDTIPSDIDPSKISYLVGWSQNGVGHSFHTRTILDTGMTSDRGWTTIETVLIRLDTNLTPSGRFPVYANVPGANGVESRIGYDAVVCVERYEPWIVEAYNTSIGFPEILRVVEKGYGNNSAPSGKLRGDPIPNTRHLNTTGKDSAFYVAHDNGINQMLKDNGRDFPYVPSPTAVSFTDGAGPKGYIELSSDRFAVIRARVDAANVLPYLAGSAPVVAQLYPDQTLAYVAYVQWQLIGVLMLVMILGTIGEVFVPTLPHNMPRRGFGIYSWFALFQSQELQFDLSHDLNKMSVEELEKKLCDMEVKFGI